jgi:GNAT superfamily N-acetyltransferase
MHNIRWIERENLPVIIPLLEMINEGTDRDILKERLQAMAEANYQCVGVFEGKELIGICGVWILVKHYVGRHIELDNVVLLPAYRNMGIGEELISWIEAWAAQQGYVGGELNCYVNNSAAVKFWLNQGYKILGFHCQKKW